MTYDILNAIERWAVGYKMIRETIAAIDCQGRMDAILVPLSWEAESYKRLNFKQGLIGIEVKSYRGDFLRGMKEKQFEKYADSESISGLYVATALNVCKTSEIPKRFGHLIVNVKPDERRSMNICVCRRHPEWKESKLSQESMWRILWAGISGMNRQIDERRREIDGIESRCREVFGRILSKAHSVAERRANV
jgi:hypothetical protein